MAGKSLIISALLCACLNAFSQQEVAEGPRRGQPMDRLILELHNDLWQEVPEGIELRPYSPGFSVFIMRDIPIFNENLSFAPGFGFSSINVHHNGFFLADSLNRSLQLHPLAPEVDYRKNKTATTYADFAAEFRIRSNGIRRLKLHLGMRGGLLISFNQKFKNEEEVIKSKNREHVRPFHYGLTARIGLGQLGICAFYSLSTLIDSGTMLRPVSGGIYLSF